MKKILLSFLLLPLLSHAETFQAKVISAQPVYGVRVVDIPMEVCEQVQVERKKGNTAGTVLGAIAGAAIGNQIGKGGGRDVATVVGGVLGAQVGGQGGRTETVTENRCRTVTRSYKEQGVLRGFDVVYRFMGRTYTARVSEHPGSTITLDVYHSIAQ